MALRYRFRHGVTLHEPPGELRLHADDGRMLRLHHPRAGLLPVLQLLVHTSGSVDELLAAAAEGGTPIAPLTLFLQLQQWLKRAWLTLSIDAGGSPAAVLEPTGRELEPRAAQAPGLRIRWSRYVMICPEEDGLLLETPLTAARLRLLDPRLAVLLPALAVPTAVDQPPAQLPPALGDQWHHLVLLLLTARVAGVCDAEGLADVDEHPVRHRWSREDLALHHRSRRGWHQQAVGTVPRTDVPAPPLLQPMADLPAVPLPQPGPAEPNPALFDVIENRRSVRCHSEAPPTLKQLSLLLWYVARIKQRQQSVVQGRSRSHVYESASRPVPAGGGMHEIQLYLTVRRCGGLEPGLYWYDPDHHQLLEVSGLSDACQQLLLDATRSAGLNQPPDILITLTARYSRVSWKYAGITYALILKNAGVIYQQLYLISTALGLSPCGLGTGDSAVLAKATATNPYEEIAVGEFVLGGTD